MLCSIGRSAGFEENDDDGFRFVVCKREVLPVCRALSGTGLCAGEERGGDGCDVVFCERWRGRRGLA